ncbi:MAG: hypothetical protein Kow0096_06090 [Thiohalomonadaceae bacterium]
MARKASLMLCSGVTIDPAWKEKPDCTVRQKETGTRPGLLSAESQPKVGERRIPTNTCGPRNGGRAARPSRAGTKPHDKTLNNSGFASVARGVKMAARDDLFRRRPME